MSPSALHESVLAWFDANERPLPWRGDVTPWAILVSEVMSQQTPVARVEPRWREWMDRWPTPADLAAAPPDEVIRAWDRLGYPRRALRLQEAAGVIATEFDGEVPSDPQVLRSLPGIGEYTAAAVAAFAFNERTVLLDTNIRRVLDRAAAGIALPAPTLNNAERQRAQDLLPQDPATSARWNAAVMELGALVCTARSPQCERCPIVDSCAWRAAGFPPDAHTHRRRTQAWHGTDRQARGAIMAALRDARAPVPLIDLARVWPKDAQREKVLLALVADGLATQGEAGYSLPHAPSR